MHITGWAFVAVALAIFLGAIMQGIIGFGMIALAFPVVVLANDNLLPQSALIAGTTNLCVMDRRNWNGVVWREVGWIAAGRFPGMGIAVFLLSVLSSTTLALAGGFTVLAAIGLGFWAPPLARSQRNLALVGVASGLFGTAIGIGGPPLGLLYQHETGPQLRSTVSVLMLMGSPISLAILALSGQVSSADLRTGSALALPALAGMLVAPRLVPWFDQRLRTVVLVACSISAIAAMAKIVLVG
ncbi:MAG: sulfite exporter TauE/SafE family protein [Acidimicrobiales bacterium]